MGFTVQTSDEETHKVFTQKQNFFQVKTPKCPRATLTSTSTTTMTRTRPCTAGDPANRGRKGSPNLVVLNQVPDTHHPYISYYYTHRSINCILPIQKCGKTAFEDWDPKRDIPRQFCQLLSDYPIPEKQEIRRIW